MATSLNPEAIQTCMGGGADDGCGITAADSIAKLDDCTPNLVYVVRLCWSRHDMVAITGQDLFDAQSLGRDGIRYCRSSFDSHRNRTVPGWDRLALIECTLAQCAVPHSAPAYVLKWRASLL